MIDKLLISIGLFLEFLSVYIVSENSLLRTKESDLEDEVKYSTISRKIERSKEVTRKSIRFLIGGMFFQGLALFV